MANIHTQKKKKKKTNTSKTQKLVELKNLWNQYYDLKNILLQLTIIVLREFTQETRVKIDTPGFKPMDL